MVSSASILGVDYGEANIGLAFGRDGKVTPLRVISGVNKETAISKILRICKEYDIDKIVIGLPLTAEGKQTSESIKVRQFANLLKVKFKKPVDFVNEFYSTRRAARNIFKAGISQKRRREKDHFSAAIILKQYYAEKASD